MYQLRFPKGFRRPEEYGWQVTNPIVPHQRLQAAMQELHRFGFVSTQFTRWQIPFRFPAGLVFMGYDSDTDQYYGMYTPPFECRERKVTRLEIWEEIRSGVGSSEGSPATRVVPPPTQ
ncbi:hypothetical protein [Streptomyces sp. NPDC057002]|uniref:hypothetical protein n=1 Tax=Streptomyces sp. NPDC057002 TaxID=3345992 RepID=UPI00362D024B